MFCAYSWFEKPELYAEIRETTLEWAGAGERVVMLDSAQAESLRPAEKRQLSVIELARLKKRLDEAWEGPAFGGYIGRPTLPDMKGLYHFKLDQEKTEARLDCLLLDLALSELPPLQNPALHLALLALLEHAPDLEAIFLPFGDVSDRDKAAMKMFFMAPTEEPGWWLTKQTFQRVTDFIALSNDLLTPTWLEVKMEVEPALRKLIVRLFGRYGFRDKVNVNLTIKIGPLGEDIEDETAPVVITTYLPKNEQNMPNLQALQQALRDLTLVRPVPELELKEVSAVQAKPFEHQQSKEVYRIGRRLVMQIVKEEPGSSDYKPQPEDLVIKFTRSVKGFGPSEMHIHPTTHLVLELLEKWIKPTEHTKVLDLGTGSGALALTAASLGANYVLALDANREAIELARQNVRLNGLEGKVVPVGGSLGLKDDYEGAYSYAEHLQQRPPELDQAMPFDAILANIFADNLINLSSALTGSLRPGGLLLSSGIAEFREEGVAAAFQQAGLELLERKELSHWIAFVHRKV